MKRGSDLLDLKHSVQSGNYDFYVITTSARGPYPSYTSLHFHCCILPHLPSVWMLNSCLQLKMTCPLFTVFAVSFFFFTSTFHQSFLHPFSGRSDFFSSLCCRKLYFDMCLMSCAHDECLFPLEAIKVVFEYAHTLKSVHISALHFFTCSTDSLILEILRGR